MSLLQFVQQRGVVFADCFLNGGHFDLHLARTEGDVDGVAQLDILRRARRFAVDQHLTRVARLVSDGAPLDQARHFQIFIQSHKNVLLFGMKSTAILYQTARQSSRCSLKGAKEKFDKIFLVGYTILY